MPQSLLLLPGSVAATLLLQFAVNLIGPAGVLFNLLIPFPAVYVAMRDRLATGAGCVILSATALGLLGGWEGCAAYLLQFGTVSLVLPQLLRRGWAWDRAVLVGLLAVLGVAVLVLVAYTQLRGISPVGVVDDYLQAELKTAVELSAQGDLPAEQQQQLRAVMEQMVRFLGDTFAAWAVVVTGGMLLLQIWLLSLFEGLRERLGGGDFASWKSPELLVWPLIVAGFLVAFADGMARQVGLNLLVILLPVYFLHGLAVVTHFSRRKGIPPLLRGMLYVFLLLFNPLPMIVTGVGVFDLWADFRKPRIKKDKA